MTTQCEEFITFPRCAEHLARVQADPQQQHEAIEYASQRQPMRYIIFHPSQFLELLLTLPPDARYTDTGNPKQMISRLLAL